MLVLELFAGTRSIGKAFERKGHKVISIDYNRNLPGMASYADIGNLTGADVIKLCGSTPDIIWASPDCTTYSVSAISHHRRLSNGTLVPITDYARRCDAINKHIISLIEELKPKYWFIENPRGGLRKMSFMQELPRYTITYCQYGDTRQKPTDIWTNHPNPQFKQPCNRGAPCHVPAPRGARTGTQGIKGHQARAVIPQELCDHIVQICLK